MEDTKALAITIDGEVNDTGFSYSPVAKFFLNAYDKSSSNHSPANWLIFWIQYSEDN